LAPNNNNRTFINELSHNNKYCKKLLAYPDEEYQTTNQSTKPTAAGCPSLYYERLQIQQNRQAL
jgi:hypothetical protein